MRGGTVEACSTTSSTNIALNPPHWLINGQNEAVTGDSLMGAFGKCSREFQPRENRACPAS